MKNRYGDEYEFVMISEDVYTITGDLKYWRFGGKEGQHGIDMSDLGMVDPSGGPYLAVGMSLGGRTIKRITVEGNLDDKPLIKFHVEQ